MVAVCRSPFYQVKSPETIHKEAGPDREHLHYYYSNNIRRSRHSRESRGGIHNQPKYRIGDQPVIPVKTGIQPRLLLSF